jgi:hypothetical protein
MRSVTDPPRTPDRDPAPDLDAEPAGAVAPDRATEPPDGGERRLARPPSERYGSGPPGAVPPSPSPAASDPASPARGIAFGAVAAIIGAAVIVALVAALTISAGLLVVAAAIGYAVGLATVAGAGATLSSPGRPAAAAVLAGLGILLGQVGLWLFARTEGGVLPLIDYLSLTFGVLVPLELLLAVAVAWWRAR